jgi:predicted acyltransferase
MKAHRTDMVSLIFGLIFLVVALGWIFGWAFRWNFNLALPQFCLFVAGGLIALGLIGLFRSLRSGRRDGTASGPDELG